MPDTSKYHLDYSPQSYWGGPEERLARIKGANRRHLFEQAIQQGRLHTIPKVLFGESISPELGKSLASMNFQNMGGESLPPLRPHEIEIARVVFDSTTADVVSFRARKSGGRIHYSVTDEYENQWSKTTPRTSIKPLTMEQLIKMINNASYPDESSVDGSVGVFDIWYMSFQESDDDAEEFLDSYRVLSPYYPEITQWFRDSEREWLDDRSSDSQDQSQDDES